VGSGEEFLRLKSTPSSPCCCSVTGSGGESLRLEDIPCPPWCCWPIPSWSRIGTSVLMHASSNWYVHIPLVAAWLCFKCCLNGLLGRTSYCWDGISGNCGYSSEWYDLPNWGGKHLWIRFHSSRRCLRQIRDLRRLRAGNLDREICARWRCRSERRTCSRWPV